MPEEKENKINFKYILALVAAVIFLCMVMLVFFWNRKIMPPVQNNNSGTQRQNTDKLKKFFSEQEFKDYLEKGKDLSTFWGGRGGGTMSMESKDMSPAPQFAGSNALPSRVSETNVQVVGIDEPDTVKTDGKEVYFSVPRPEIMPLDDTVGRADESKELYPLQQTGGVKAIKAFPLANAKVDSKIDKSGDLLLFEKNLVVIPTQRYYWAQDTSRIYGYDVADPEKPEEKWNIEIKNSSSIAAARLYQGKIYLAIKTDFVDNQPCVIEPLVVQGAPFSVRCTDIYHPEVNVPAEATFTAMIIDPVSGKIENSVSFVGSSDFSSSAVYMSGSALYLTYYYPGDTVKILASFFSDNKDLVPEWLAQKLANLQGYDISNSAKMTEIWNLVSRFQNSLSPDDKLKVQNEIGNRMGDFFKKHRRELDSTGIVKINADSLKIDATTNVPGKLLNQFSLDEYKGNLRVATTIGQNFLGWGFGFSSGTRSNDTVNDVYVLDGDLKTEGSVVDLGKGEQIYAVRFLSDKGYVVTFKQIDPFFVLDLSDPQNPQEKGELKIPGYSSYLHPIAENRILGIGSENGKVKVSLFDVSNPSNPQEISKYNLNEYYSEISQTHHAFLQDEKHRIFFLPGAQGGYVFSYEGDKLNLEKAISGFAIQRAVYINDYLYIIGDDKLSVFDETNWEKVKEIAL
jgi:inhibitor of cysteine peptidase